MFRGDDPDLREELRRNKEMVVSYLKLGLYPILWLPIPRADAEHHDLNGQGGVPCVYFLVV